MRIVVDLQGAQTTVSRHRGIGRYTLSLAYALLRQAREHEVIIALNGLFPDTIEPIRAAFDGLLPQENILVWQVPGSVRDLEPSNNWRRQVAEHLREAFLASLKPDVVFVSSLFEGLVDDAVTSIGTFKNLPTAVIIYDLIPLLYREHYLQNPQVEAWYLRKLDHLRRADLWLAISESSKKEGIHCLGLPEEWVFNISSAIDGRFHPIQLPPDRVESVCRKYGLVRPFILYTGGIDYRKNIKRLISAFAALPENTRKAHQLAVVCSIQPTDKDALVRFSIDCGLSADDVVLTGFIPDEDLLALYNLCKLFVFPSWHEGFGLPALEAMACGAAVIGSNTSSLPEVIGRADALFDPFDEASITAKMHQVLVNEAFRSELQKHGLKQASNFSWERTARRALNAFESLYECRCQREKREIYIFNSSRPRLAYISPLPPEKSGIADYSSELLPELSRYYQIDVIVNQPEITDPWIKANCPVRSLDWFVENAWRYNRTLYHLGNSHFHIHMFDLLEQCPGVVVLHDFYLSGVLAYMEMHNVKPNAWTNALYLSHGYPAVRRRFQAEDVGDVIWHYPSNLPVLQQALGVIVHSHFSTELARSWYGPELAADWYVIPHLRALAHGFDRVAARQALGLNEEDFVVCSFGLLGPSKLNHRLLAAWLASPMAKKKNCWLIFVGENHSGEYGRELLDTIRRSGCGDRIKITGFAPHLLYKQYLAAADVAVQLRTFSRGETSGTVLDCMSYGLPTVVNAHGSLAELPADCVVMLPDKFTDGQLLSVLEVLWRDLCKRRVLGERARNYIVNHHNPRRIVDLFAQAIEEIYKGSTVIRQCVMKDIATLEGTPTDENLWVKLATALSENLPLLQSQKQLLVDISELVQRDAKSGIQRVVRSVLNVLLEHPPAGFRVEPVYATEESSYRYARKFTLKLLDCPQDLLPDEPVEFHQGDVFLGLDLQPLIVPQQIEFLKKARLKQIKILFVVYDLLPVLRPDCFIDGAEELYIRWLNFIAQGDGALCISRAVADELVAWLDAVQPERQRPFHIGWFHLGADIESSVPTTGMPAGFAEQLAQIRSRPSILMVGTVEPRKGYAQALGAFELLWAAGAEVNLVIVGKQGWMVEALVERLKFHPEAGRRLFWYQGISDEALLKLYEIATGVLMASEGEGFGLPLIEAAQHGLPILARDIPVFREVAGEFARYFSGHTSQDLAKALQRWMEELRMGTAPSSQGMPWQTWAESTKQIIGLLTDPQHPNWLYRWLPHQSKQEKLC